MELFIQIRNGQPFQHPILGENFREAFPHIDTNNLPPEFARFERIEPPQYGVYEVLLGPLYQWVDGIVKDVWEVRPMTAQEVSNKQTSIKVSWAEHGFASWLFDETACAFVPPVPYPTDGKRYVWDEAQQNWVEVSA
jgi:hypothetical protein